MLGNQITAPHIDSVAELKHLLAVMADPKKTAHLLEQISSGLSKHEEHMKALVEKSLVIDKREKELVSKEKELIGREASVEQREKHHQAIEVSLSDKKLHMDELEAHVSSKSAALDKHVKTVKADLAAKQLELEAKLSAAKMESENSKALIAEYNEKIAKLKSAVGV